MSRIPHFTDNVEEIGRTGISQDDDADRVYCFDKRWVGGRLGSLVGLVRWIDPDSDGEGDE